MNGIEFIETSVFTRQFKALATDDELSALQAELIAYPDKGDLIVGTAGLRKIRLATGAKGKRSGARVVYYLASLETIFLLVVYSKNEKTNLSADEKKLLKQWVLQLKQEQNDEPI